MITNQQGVPLQKIQKELTRATLTKKRNWTGGPLQKIQKNRQVGPKPLYYNF